MYGYLAVPLDRDAAPTAHIVSSRLSNEITNVNAKRVKSDKNLVDVVYKLNARTLYTNDPGILYEHGNGTRDMIVKRYTDTQLETVLDRIQCEVNRRKEIEHAMKLVKV
ncbi:hypothetical protein QAD02_001437 [Eretmocerus hayati]|uniref:Uncharacterized protein n=1 Tax=Eretmocerus hayati TaxID=131215 RepID=A0ACC2NG82_9HYME|nr:hypothetical protein QAD02_001437 [Eretmocerus hayati]